MKRFAIWRIAGLGLLLIARPAVVESGERLNVVTTLSTFGDVANAIGGEAIELSAIASPKFNPHFIEPKPSDVLRVKRARLLVHGGLDLELWRGPLLDAAGNQALFPGQPGELDLSQGLQLLEVPVRPPSRAEGDIHLYGNPHYWLHPDNVRRMAQAICDKLCQLDPDHTEAYHGNLRAFLEGLDARIAAWRTQLAPFRGRELVGYHNEWIYLMDFGGLTMTQFLEPKPGIPPTPKQLEFIEGYVRERRIPAVVQATYQPREAGESLAKRAGVRVLLLCQNVRERTECGDYLAMMGYNIDQLAAALHEETTR